MKVLVIAGVAKSLVNFRGQLIRDICNSGARVSAIAGDITASNSAPIMALGMADCGSYHLVRHGLNPVSELRTLAHLRRWFVKTQPDLVFAYTAKPVIWGGIVSRFFSSNFVPMITGLGGQCGDDRNRRKFSHTVTLWLYRIALQRSSVVIFQNREDRDFFIRSNVVKASQCVVVDGSGVDLQLYTKQELPPLPLVFSCAARLISQKGIREYAEAARIVRQSHPDVTFLLAGRPEEGPGAVPVEEVREWHRLGHIDYVGILPDIRDMLMSSHVFVLPSFYGEGLPRTLLEALATGRPVITTENVGCREAVAEGETGSRPGDNGWLVPVKSVDALAKAMMWFIEHPERLADMQDASHDYARRRFEIRKINADMLEHLGIVSSGRQVG